MKKLTVYLDTSVIGGCFDSEFEEWSNQLIEEIKNDKKIGVISEITIKELINAPEKIKMFFKLIEDKFTILEINQEIISLANDYINSRIVSHNYFEDAQHIAAATINNTDILVSWNFKHIVNFNKIKNYNIINIKNGYKAIEIRTPREVIDNVS